jgi:hypothetical protein
MSNDRINRLLNNWVKDPNTGYITDNRDIR